MKNLKQNLTLRIVLKRFLKFCHVGRYNFYKKDSYIKKSELGFSRKKIVPSPVDDVNFFEVGFPLDFQSISSWPPWNFPLFCFNPFRNHNFFNYWNYSRNNILKCKKKIQKYKLTTTKLKKKPIKWIEICNFQTKNILKFVMKDINKKRNVKINKQSSHLE